MRKPSRSLPVIPIFIVLAVAAVSPIFAVRYFVNQDGPAHVYTAGVIVGLLKGDGTYSSTYRINPAPLPNSLGHWLLAACLLVTDQIFATKVISALTLILCAMSIAVLWLRTSEVPNTSIGAIYGFVVAMNWLWLEGFYNFTLGVAGFALAIGLFAGWDRLSALRTCVLGVVSVLVYFSHELCFLATAGSLLLLALWSSDRRRGVAHVCGALAPSVVMLGVYQAIHPSGGLSPAWINLADKAVSLSSLLTQVRTADPFPILLPRHVPFVDDALSAAVILAPGLWVALGVACLLTGRARGPERSSTDSAFVLLAGLFLLGALFLPDTFGPSSGGIIRPRFTVFAFVVLTPVVSKCTKHIHRTIAACILLAVFGFQTLSLWDYSIHTSADAAELLSASGRLSDGDALASISVVTEPRRYAAFPLIHAADLLPGRRSVIDWSCYEFAYPYFPVVMRSAQDQSFSNMISDSTVIDGANWDRNILSHQILELSQHANVLSTWDANAEMKTIIERYYEPVPGLSSGRSIVYRRRAQAE